MLLHKYQIQHINTCVGFSYQFSVNTICFQKLEVPGRLSGMIPGHRLLMRQNDLKGGRKGKTMILQGQLPARGAFIELQAGPWEALAWEL